MLVPGRSRNKIAAINRDIHLVKDWDILVVAADDMICVKKDWDEQIKNTMLATFPDGDGVLHFNDGFVGEKLNTLPILTKKYYDRFGYAYNPEYISLWCDNEFMDVAKQLKKQIYISDVLFRHEHYSNIKGMKMDKLIIRTESFYHQDRRTYEKRKKINFGL